MCYFAEFSQIQHVLRQCIARYGKVKKKKKLEIKLLFTFHLRSSKEFYRFHLILVKNCTLRLIEDLIGLVTTPYIAYDTMIVHVFPNCKFEQLTYRAS